MQIPKKAIEKAIEGGWEEPKLQSVMIGSARRFGMATAEQMLAAYIALDPSFWQALGKALGWNERTDAFVDGRDDLTTIGGETWRIQALCFYNLILTGENTDQFWKELLGE